jgi:hypothetical protein
MKRSLSFLFSICLTCAVLAQAPSLICYQGVAANSSGAELVSTDISLRATILRGSATGSPIYSETHDTKTDQFGLFTIDLGSKPTAGNDLSKLDWSKGSYFLKIEMAIPKGSVFKDLGTTQLLSVPYALHALHASSADTALVAKTATNDKDTDPTNELQALSFDPTTGKLKLVSAKDPLGGPEITIKDNDSDPKNEIQTLKFDPKTGTIGLYDNNGAKNSEIKTREGMFTEPGASASFPQGLIGNYRFIKAKDTYTVPQGKAFYVTANGSPSTKIEVEYLGINYQIDSYHSCPVFPAGTIIKNSIITGFDIDNNPMIEPAIIDLSKPYNVPPNKVLIITSGILPGNFTLKVDGETTSFLLDKNGTQYISIPGGLNGVAIIYPFVLNPSVLTGYLMPNQ